MELHTLSILAQPQTTRIHLSEVCYPDTLRPQVTFKVGVLCTQDSASCCRINPAQLTAICICGAYSAADEVLHLLGCVCLMKRRDAGMYSPGM